jgi:D-aminoacyl-tRNA deacylase
VSQFTILANTRKGNKPDFHGAAKPEEAKRLYDYFLSKLQDIYLVEKVKNGVFQAMMEVGLVNDGPVGASYRRGNGAVLPSSMGKLADVKQVTLEIETNPPKKEKNSDGATSESSNAFPNGTASPMPPQELLD